MLGWIKLHRQLSEKAFYSKDSEKVHLWIHLLIKANHSGREEMFAGNPIACKSGQFTTGRKQLAKETGINESKIERILTYFEKIEQQIEQQKSSTNRLVSILNWSKHQDSEQRSEQQVNNDRTTSEQQVNNNRTHYKNVKNVKELNNDKNEEYNYKKILLSEIEISDVSTENQNYLNIAKSFQKLIIKNCEELGVSTKDIIKTKGVAVDTIRLLLTNDNYTLEDAQDVFKHLENEIPENGFSWKQNILSIKTLRSKFDKLKIAANARKNKQQSNKKGISTERLAQLVHEEFGDPD